MALKPIGHGKGGSAHVHRPALLVTFLLYFYFFSISLLKYQNHYRLLGVGPLLCQGPLLGDLQTGDMPEVEIEVGRSEVAPVTLFAARGRRRLVLALNDVVVVALLVLFLARHLPATDEK